jgi:hypothetical protein
MFHPLSVMAGLVPAIHVETVQGWLKVSGGGPTWMAGTSPAMTMEGRASC